MSGLPKALEAPKDGACPKCGREGHGIDECEEKRIGRVWPGRHVFKGRVRMPEGGFIEFDGLPLEPEDAKDICAILLKAWNAK